VNGVDTVVHAAAWTSLWGHQKQSDALLEEDGVGPRQPIENNIKTSKINAESDLKPPFFEAKWLRESNPMARANRHFLPGYVWHITHRCHKKEFLLKFARDRQRWKAWLFEAKKRYGLDVLNYTVTSNHIHLLAFDKGNQEIAKSMQLIAGRTTQEYNNRKRRKGACWEDRYHATAVETGEHLARCIVYIELNMVRVGAVGHPASWKHSGYQEIQTPPGRYSIINRAKLRELLDISGDQMLIDTHRKWIEEALNVEDAKRQGY
jgi:putative transposase